MQNIPHWLFGVSVAFVLSYDLLLFRWPACALIRSSHAMYRAATVVLFLFLHEAAARIYFQESFNDKLWEKRWVKHVTQPNNTLLCAGVVIIPRVCSFFLLR